MKPNSYIPRGTTSRNDKGLWNHHAPRAGRCWSCKSKNVSNIEFRHTGTNHELQAWPFCPSCWRFHVEITRKPVVDKLILGLVRTAGLDPRGLGIRIPRIRIR